jgi:hypothetical protein
MPARRLATKRFPCAGAGIHHSVVEPPSGGRTGERFVLKAASSLAAMVQMACSEIPLLNCLGIRVTPPKN